MILELNDEDIKMLKRKLDYHHCLYWDSELETNEDYCDGECYECNKPFTFNVWITNKTMEDSNEENM